LTDSDCGATRKPLQGELRKSQNSIILSSSQGRGREEERIRGKAEKDRKGGGQREHYQNLNARGLAAKDMLGRITRREDVERVRGGEGGGRERGEGRSEVLAAACPFSLRRP